MPIEAPLSKHSRTNYKLGIVLLLGLAVVFAYDGYLSQYPWSLRRKFYEEHTRALLFQLDSKPSAGLDGGVISAELRRSFAEAKRPLSAAATLSPRQAGRQWVLTDGVEEYSLRMEDTGLAVYRTVPDDTMVLNRILPIFFGTGAIVLGAWFWWRKDMRLVAAESELIISANKRIPYDAIEQIDKTHFDSKGFFRITYKTAAGRQVNRKLSGYTYDNLRPLLDLLIAKIT
jgi:hypothetical protein